jgi:hypothetical protein
MFEENVTVVQSKGDEECFVCDGKFNKKEPGVAVGFNVPAILTTIRVKRQMHLGCAEELRRILDARIAEARRL